MRHEVDSRRTIGRIGPITAWIAGLVLAIVILAASTAGAYMSSTWFEDATGYEDALRQQRAQHAPMLVYFRTDWCPFCRKFDARLQDYEMMRKLGGAIKVRLNPEHGPAERKLFEQQFGARGFPAIYWVPEGGAPRRLQAGKSVEEFLQQLPSEPASSPVDEVFWRNVLEPESLGHARVDDPTVVDVDRPS